MSEERGKTLQRVCLRHMLKELLLEAKKGYEGSFCMNFWKLHGMILYMELVGDISEENGAKVRKLAETIRDKYNILCY